MRTTKAKIGTMRGGDFDGTKVVLLGENEEVICAVNMTEDGYSEKVWYYAPEDGGTEWRMSYTPPRVQERWIKSAPHHRYLKPATWLPAPDAAIDA